MRPATLEERHEFYEQEFSVDRVRRWFRGRPIPLFAVKLCSATGIYKPEFEGQERDPILLTQTTIGDLCESLLYHLPEGVYYDRNLYRNSSAEDLRAPENILGQELAFDVDPENFDCPVCGTLQNRLDRGETFTFCLRCFGLAQATAVKLYDYLKTEFSALKPVYSGRGFHIHVRDRRATVMSMGERKELSQAIIDRGIEHDEWVANGGVSLIRLPHTLHGLVSRVVAPISAQDLPTFDPLTHAKPAYL